MRSPLLRGAATAVRLWTRLYTSRLAAAVRDARRAEIESDLWEHAQDAASGAPARMAVQVLLRLLLGMPDDLVWRLERESSGRHPLRLALGAAACLVIAVSMLVVRSTGTELPSVPDAPVRARGESHPAPPPPPPPPARPGAAEGDSPPPSFVYGTTSFSVSPERQAPAKIRDVPPVYPPIAIAYGLEGTVTVEARITEDGRIADARVVQPAAVVLSRSAIQAVQQWAFAPGAAPHAGGPQLLTVTVNFARPK